jgi:pimeloyl-ACP methyl ester carboxylesterase
LKQIQFKNTSISYSDTGKVPLFLLHGFLENQSMWDNYIRLFPKEQVITIDLLGHGETECLGYVHSMEDNADAVHSVLLELRIQINSRWSFDGWLCGFGFRRIVS